MIVICDNKKTTEDFIGNKSNDTHAHKQFVSIACCQICEWNTTIKAVAPQTKRTQMETKQWVQGGEEEEEKLTIIGEIKLPGS